MAAKSSASLLLSILYMLSSASSLTYDPRLHILKGKIRQGSPAFRIGSGLVFAVEGIDILDKFPVQKLKRDAFRTYPAALAAVCTASGHMISPDNMEHLLLKGIGIGFLAAVKLIAVKHAFQAAAGRTDIPAGVAADTFGKLFLPEREPLLR